MSELLIPNTCQVPNVLLDEIMPGLSGSSLKILLAIVRKTYGFQKQSDKISFRTLQKLTGLSRDAVNRGIKGLGSLVTITPGAKGVPTLEGVNKYALNLDIKTGELVRKSDQSENLTSQKNREKQVRKSDSSKPNSSKPNIAARKKTRAARPDADPRIKTLIDAFHTRYVAKVGSKPVITGKDGESFKRLLAGHDVETVTAALDRYFADPFYSSTGYDVAVFAKAFNRLNSAGAAKRRHNFDEGAFPSL